MLEVRNVSAGYHEASVLHDVNLAFEPGKLTVLIGPNGCGKSTLLRAAAGLMPVQQGEVCLEGRPLREFSSRKVAQKVSYLAQSKNAPDITVRKLVLHGRFPYLSYPRRYSGADHEIVQWAMERMGIAQLAQKSMQQLSGGQRQQAFIAMTLAQDCETVLMDEPTTYLDISHQLHLIRLTQQMAQQGKAVGLVLHDLPLALKAADRVVVLSDGRIRQICTSAELLQSNLISEVFDVRLHSVEAAGEMNYFCTL